MSALVHLSDVFDLIDIRKEADDEGRRVVWLRSVDVTVSITCTQATAGRIAQALSAVPEAMERAA